MGSSAVCGSSAGGEALVEPARILEVYTEALRKLGKRERAFLDELAAFPPLPAGGTRFQRKRAKDEA